MAEARTVCLVPVWDGPYRFRCGQGTAGVCARHGRHRPHPDDGRECVLDAHGYCGTHGLYENDVRRLSESRENDR